MRVELEVDGSRRVVEVDDGATPADLDFLAGELRKRAVSKSFRPAGVPSRSGQVSVRDEFNAVPPETPVGQVHATHLDGLRERLALHNVTVDSNGSESGATLTGDITRVAGTITGSIVGGALGFLSPFPGGAAAGIAIGGGAGGFISDLVAQKGEISDGARDSFNYSRLLVETSLGFIPAGRGRIATTAIRGVSKAVTGKAAGGAIAGQALTGGLFATAGQSAIRMAEGEPLPSLGEGAIVLATGAALSAGLAKGLARRGLVEGEQAVARVSRATKEEVAGPIDERVLSAVESADGTLEALTRSGNVARASAAGIPRDRLEFAARESLDELRSVGEKVALTPKGVRNTNRISPIDGSIERAERTITGRLRDDIRTLYSDLGIDFEPRRFEAGRRFFSDSKKGRALAELAQRRKDATGVAEVGIPRGPKGNEIPDIVSPEEVLFVENPRLQKFFPWAVRVSNMQKRLGAALDDAFFKGVNTRVKDQNGKFLADAQGQPVFRNEKLDRQTSIAEDFTAGKAMKFGRDREVSTWVGKTTPGGGPGLEAIYKGITKVRDREVITGLLEKTLTPEQAAAVEPRLKKAAEQLRKFYNESFKAHDLDPTTFVENYAPRLRKFGSIEKAFPSGDIPVAVKAFARFAREGDVVFRETDSLKAALRYTKALADEKHLGKNFRAAVDRYAFVRDNVDPLGGSSMIAFFNTIKGSPDPLFEAVSTSFRNITKRLGVNISEEALDQFSSNLVASQYAAVLGFRVGPAIRNSTQFIQTTYSQIGGEGIAAGIKEAMTKEGRELAESIGVTQGQVVNLAKTSTLGRGLATRSLAALNKSGLFMFQSIEDATRTVAFLGTRRKSLNAARKAAGDVEKWADISDLDRISPAFAEPIKAVFRTGDVEAAANMHAQHITDLTMFGYAVGERPEILTGRVGKAIGSLGVWPASYASFLGEGFRHGPAWKSHRDMTRFIQANAVLGSTFAAAGYAFGDEDAVKDNLGWLFLSPIYFTGSPLFGAITAVGQAVTGGGPPQRPGAFVKAFKGITPLSGISDDFRKAGQLDKDEGFFEGVAEGAVQLSKGDLEAIGRIIGTIRGRFGEESDADLIELKVEKIEDLMDTISSLAEFPIEMLEMVRDMPADLKNEVPLETYRGQSFKRGRPRITQEQIDALKRKLLAERDLR